MGNECISQGLTGVPAPEMLFSGEKMNGYRELLVHRLVRVILDIEYIMPQLLHLFLHHIHLRRKRGGKCGKKRKKNYQKNSPSNQPHSLWPVTRPRLLLPRFIGARVTENHFAN